MEGKFVIEDGRLQNAKKTALGREAGARAHGLLHAFAYHCSEVGWTLGLYNSEHTCTLLG